MSPQTDATGMTWNGNAMSQNDMMEKDTVLVLDQNDNVIGSESKKGAHIFNKEQPRGILHRAFSAFLFDEKTGDLLLQKRAASKITFPNVWTNTCCSHPLHGMSPPELDTPADVQKGTVYGAKNAAIRKLDHELGIPAKYVPLEKFKFLTRLHYWAADTVTHGKESPWGEHEIDYVLFILVDKETLPVKPHPEEVDDIKWVSKKQLIEEMKVGLWSPWFRLIANRWLVSEGGWWDDLKTTMETSKFCDYDIIHRFDPPKEHMGGGGDAGPLLGSLEENAAKEMGSKIKQEQFKINEPQFNIRMSIICCMLATFFSLAILFKETNDIALFLPPSLIDIFATYLDHFPLQEATFEVAMSICILSIIVSLYSIFSAKSQLLKIKMNMPYVPSPFPFFGSVKDFILNVPWDLITNWHLQYGPVFSFTLLGRTCVAISSPTYLRIVLQSKIKNVKKDVEFSYKPFLPILGTGIVTSEGKSWMRQRLNISAALRFDVLEDIPRITLIAVQNLCAKLDKAAEDGSTVELAEELRHLTLQVISATFFSLDAEESNTTFAQMYLPIVDEANKRVWHPERSFAFFLPFFWRHRKNCSRLDNYVSKLIEDRWELRQREQSKCDRDDSKRERDILDRVLAKYEKDNSAVWNAEVVRQLRDEMKTFMLAGHETSAAMMTWAIFELLNNDELETEVRNEGISVFGDKYDWCADGVDDKKLPNREELSKLSLCEGSLKEALRKYSVVPTVSRMVVEDTEVGSHVIPKGSTLFISIQGVHHNPNIWPEPMKFDPKRFCDPSPIPAPYTFIPFIEGPRNCLGQYLALLESKIVLGMLMQRYKFTLKNPIDGNPKHLYMVPVIPKAGVYVTISKRF